MSKYQEHVQKPAEFLSLTGHTVEEFQALVPPFTHCFYERMQSHQLNGKARGKRRYSDYKNSPLATIEDKLFFILSYLKSNNLQMVQGSLFHLSQPKANQWIHTLHPVLNQALALAGALPARDGKGDLCGRRDPLLP